MSYFENFDYKQILEIVAVFNDRVVIIGGYNTSASKCFIAAETNPHCEQRIREALMEEFGDCTSVEFTNSTQKPAVSIQNFKCIRRGRLLSTEIYAKFEGTSLYLGRHSCCGNNVTVTAKINFLLARELNCTFSEKFGTTVRVEYLSNELGQYPA